MEFLLKKLYYNSAYIYNPLHIYDTPYEERETPEYGDGQLRRVDGDRLFPKWGWAVEKVNTIR